MFEHVGNTSTFFISFLVLIHCVKSAQIRIYFWSVFSCIRSRNKTVFGLLSSSGSCNHVFTIFFASCQVICRYHETVRPLAKLEDNSVGQPVRSQCTPFYSLKTSSFFRKFSVLSFLVTLVLKFALLPYYRPNVY